MLDAQSGDTITFDPAVFAPDVPATIYLTSSLPLISQGNLKIDASNAGVILDGSNISEDFTSGLEIVSDGNTIQGLQTVNVSPGAGISLSGGAQRNTIGGDRRVGSGPLGQGNLVSGNGIGIRLIDEGTSFNTITGNLIGTDATEADAWGNSSSGIYIENGARGNTIGPDNIIAYNEDGITIRDLNSLCNTITQNSIHDNEYQGIYAFEGGNTELAAPFVFDFDLATGTVTGTACANGIIEIFSDRGNEGEVYEGRATADSTGAFTFNKGAFFTGPHLTATATDADGNTSWFSIPTSGTSRALVLQQGNNLPRTQLEPKQSRELEDNRIGWLCPLEPGLSVQQIEDTVRGTKRLGLKWVESGFDYYDWPFVEATGRYSEYYIDPDEDKAITDYVNDGIKIMCTLIFWDEEILDEMGEENYSRFKTEEEIQRWLDYVRFIVRHFKGRIEYYHIWNEPNCPWLPGQHVVLTDSINLVKRTVPVIRQEDPRAKIVVGGLPGMHHAFGRDYFFGIIKSEVMPLVDAISWHPFIVGDSPGVPKEFQDGSGGPEYYYDYPSLVQEIKDMASAHGFKGEYIAKELQWLSPSSSGPLDVYRYSEIVAAKYTARGIVMHLGMDITTGLAGVDADVRLHVLRPIERAVQNLCTIMAGTEPISLPVEIQTEATNIRSYSFSLPNGDKLVALWIDGKAVDNYPGINTTLIIPVSARRAVGIDILHGFEQELVTSIEDGNLVIRDL